MHSLNNHLVMKTTLVQRWMVTFVISDINRTDLTVVIRRVWYQVGAINNIIESVVALQHFIIELNAMQTPQLAILNPRS